MVRWSVTLCDNRRPQQNQTVQSHPHPHPKPTRKPQLEQEQKAKLEQQQQLDQSVKQETKASQEDTGSEQTGNQVAEPLMLNAAKSSDEAKSQPENSTEPPPTNQGEYQLSPPEEALVRMILK